jgi:hypothetical protein
MAHQVNLDFYVALKEWDYTYKDNPARRNRNGSKLCFFCNVEESIKHLFFECAYARFRWRVVHIVLGIVPPLNIDDLFNNWIKQGGGVKNQT